MRAITAMTFQYSGLPAETADRLRQSVAAIRSIQRSAVADVGNHPIAAKEMLEHGAFSAWAEAELGMTLRSAEKYMNAARFLADNTETVSFLPPTVIYALAAPTAPPAVVNEVVVAAEAGKMPAPMEIMAALSAAKEAERIANAAAVKTPEQLAKERKGRKSKAAREARKAAERKAEEAKRQREEQNRADRLRPLAGRIIATVGDKDLHALVTVLDNWRDIATLLRLLRESVAPARGAVQ